MRKDNFSQFNENWPKTWSTKTILKKAFLRNFSNIKTLRMKGLRRQFWKDKSFWELSQDHWNLILELDTTCPLTVENLILLPAFIKDFDQILVVHLYTPIEVLIERICERRLNGLKTSNHVNQILKAYQATTQKHLKLKFFIMLAILILNTISVSSAWKSKCVLIRLNL